MVVQSPLCAQAFVPEHYIMGKIRYLSGFSNPGRQRNVACHSAATDAVLDLKEKN